MNKETALQNKIRIALSNLGVITWRNNTFKLPDPETGRWVTGGLCEGSSDLIGITPDGRFLAIEVKVKGKRPTKAQTRFIDIVRKHGGVAGVAHSVQEALDIINEGG